MHSGCMRVRPCLCCVHCSLAGTGKDDTVSWQCWTGPSREWPVAAKRKQISVCMACLLCNRALETILA